MAKRSEYADHVCELLAPLGEVRVRAMFGGHGVYLDGLMFALIADDALYLKVDDATRGRYEARGIGPFQPFDDKPVTMSYYPLPEELFDEPDDLIGWAREAFEVALRARRPKKKTRTA